MSPVTDGQSREDPPSRLAQVSVVIPVFNAARTIRGAVDSILDQELPPTEVILVDDGSTDSTSSVIGEIRDRRVRVLRNSENRGIVYALNRGIRESVCPLIARLDADDVSFRQRLRVQVESFSEDPTLGLLASAWETSPPTFQQMGPAEARLLLLFGNRLSHSTVMFRREAFDDAGGYQEKAWPAEDYDLWLRISSRWRVRSLPDVLVRMSVSPQGISASNRERQREAAARVSALHLSELLGREVTPGDAGSVIESRFERPLDVGQAQRLILEASAAVRRECRVRGIGSDDLPRATAFLLHRMRYRTQRGRRVLWPMAILPLRSPRVAVGLLTRRFLGR